MPRQEFRKKRRGATLTSLSKDFEGIEVPEHVRQASKPKASIHIRMTGASSGQEILQRPDLIGTKPIQHGEMEHDVEQHRECARESRAARSPATFCADALRTRRSKKDREARKALPRTEYGEHSYQGHDRLAGRAALIRGATAASAVLLPFVSQKRALTYCSAI